jgi:hypothetical protein
MPATDPKRQKPGDQQHGGKKVANKVQSSAGQPAAAQPAFDGFQVRRERKQRAGQPLGEAVTDLEALLSAQPFDAVSTRRSRSTMWPPPNASERQR